MSFRVVWLVRENHPPHTQHACGQNCFADDFAVLIIAAIILASVFLYNQRTQWHVKVHFVHLCLQRSTHTALNLFSLFAFVSAAANGFKVESSLQEINIWFTSVGWYGGNVRTPYLHMGRFHLICYFDVSINSLSQEKDYSTGIIFVAKLQNQAAKFLVLYSLCLYSLNLQYNMI